MAKCDGCSGCDYNFCRKEKKVSVFVYTSDCCPKCVELKERYKREGVLYEERDANRIKSPQDEIDREALINASMRNMELPIIVHIP